MFLRFQSDDACYEFNVHEDPIMTHLKTQVAEQKYVVDSALVADEMVRKMRIIRSARHELVSGPGQTPQPKLRGL